MMDLVVLLVVLIPGYVMANCTGTSSIKYQATIPKNSYIDDLVYGLPLVKCTFRNLSEPHSLSPLFDFPNIFVEMRILESNISTFTFTTVTNTTDVFYLEVSGCGVKTIAKSAFSWYKNLEVLNFTHNHLEEVALDTFKGLERLEALDFSYNSIQKLFAEKDFNENLPSKLSRIDFSHNKLRSINSNFTKHLAQLTWVDFSYNSIKRLNSVDFVGCHLLKYLDLSHNSIEVVPDGYFLQMNKLDFLSLSNNLLQRVSLSGLSKLRELNLSNNSLLEFNSTAALQRLRILNLANNNISSLHLEDIPLKRLDIDHNHFACKNLSDVIYKFEAAGVYLVRGDLNKDILRGLSCLD